MDNNQIIKVLNQCQYGRSIIEMGEIRFFKYYSLSVIIKNLYNQSHKIVNSSERNSSDTDTHVSYELRAV